jgi:hypothetical protein
MANLPLMILQKMHAAADIVVLKVVVACWEVT